jgi:hypothetical protein
MVQHSGLILLKCSWILLKKQWSHRYLSVVARGAYCLLSRMSLLLGRNWQKALQVVDQNEVECFIGENSRRHIFQVWAGAAVGLLQTEQYRAASP